MIVWIILFLLVILISFILALRSMRHYRERPVNLGVNFGLYLIQNPVGLTGELINSLALEIGPKGAVLSFERLFKGQRRALLVYGPANLLSTQSTQLGLLELEEYTNKPGPYSLAFEVGERVNSKFNPQGFHLMTEGFELADNEQIWWQVVTKPQTNSSEVVFNSIIRVVIQAGEESRLSQIQARLLLNIAEANLTRLPRTQSSTKTLEYYSDRAVYNQFSKGEYLPLSSDDLFGLIRSL